MELFQIELTGFKKFKDTTTLKTRGKVIAILGPNEAGKSSLLRALHLLDVDQPYAPHERSRGAPEKFPVVKATYLLSEADRAAAGISVGTWFEITKKPSGERSWTIRPTPPDRNYAHRAKLLQRVNRLSKASVAVLSGIDEGLYADTVTMLEDIFRDEKELLEDAKQQLSNIGSRWQSAVGNDASPKLYEFRNAIDIAISVETAESCRISAGKALWKRLPEFLLFSSEDRDLKPSYLWSEISASTPTALSNLAKIAEIDLPKLGSGLI